MDREAAEELAASWVAAWNAHDVEAVLAHFADEVEFSSPLVPVITGKDNPVRGKAELRAYWEEGLRRLPDLEFTLLGVFAGAGAVAINYRNERGRDALETLVLGDDGRAVRGYALYGPDVIA